MKRRDKFIETEQGMKVMKTWLMKNVTIMSNVFIKVRLCRAPWVYVWYNVRDSYTVGKHTLIRSVHCAHGSPVLMVRCFGFCSLSVCIITAKTFIAFISRHCIKEQKDKRCKHISSSKPYACPTLLTFSILLFCVCGCCMKSWDAFTAMLANCNAWPVVSERANEQKSTLFLCCVLCFLIRFEQKNIPRSRCCVLLPVAMCECGMQLRVRQRCKWNWQINVMWCLS